MVRTAPPRDKILNAAFTLIRTKGYAEAVITVLACNLIWLTKLMMEIPNNRQTAKAKPPRKWKLPPLLEPRCQR
jgi:hypothetical protein